MMMREQQWDRSNCRHFRIDVCLHQRIYMRAFVNNSLKWRPILTHDGHTNMKFSISRGFRHEFG